MTHINLASFLDKIMNIKVLRMGGLSAGVIGSSSTEDTVIYGLRVSATAFAREYVKPKPDTVALSKLSEEIEGGLRTLQLTNELSVEDVEELVIDLRTLAENKLD